MTDELTSDSADHFGVAGGACQKCQYPKFMCECIDPPPRVGFMEMPAHRYHSDPCDEPSLSSSIGHMLISKSPAHAHRAHPRLGGKPRKPTRSMDDGTHLHQRVLGTGGPTVELVKLLNRKHLPVRDYKTKAAQEMKKEIEQRGHVAMLPHELARLDDLGVSVLAVLAERGIDFQDEGSQREVAVFWEELTTGGEVVQCRAMLDYFNHGRAMVEDLKTTRSAHPRDIARAVQTFGYDVQAAAYTSAVGHVHPELLGRVGMRWTFCELEPPYAVTPARPTEALMELGRLKWQQAIDLWALYRGENRWPSYVEGTALIEPVKWAFDDFEETI